MNNAFLSTIRKFSAFLLIASLLIITSYSLVYKASFLPNGFDIVATQHNSMTLKSFNLIGMEKEITTITFSEEEKWKIDELTFAVNRQKDSLVLLFSFVSISGFVFFYKIMNGLKLWKAVIESSIILALFMPLLSVVHALNRISDLLS